MTLTEKALEVWYRLESRFIPDEVWEKDLLTQWRERIVLFIFFFAAALGPFALIPSLYLSVQEKLWSIVVLDSAVYFLVLIVLFSGKVSLELKTWLMFCIFYALGIILLIVLGFLGAGYIWLFGASLIVGAMIGVNAALLALFVNLISLVFIGVYISYVTPEWALTIENPAKKWMVMIGNFMLIDTIITLLVAVLLNTLKSALEKEQKISRELNRKQEEFQAIFKASPDPIIVLDESNSVQYINQAFTSTFGWEPEELKGKVYSFDPEGKEVFSTALFSMEKSSEKRSEIRLETKAVTKDKNILDVILSAAPINEKEKGTAGLVVTLKDITGSRKIEQQLQQAKKMESLGLLAGGVAHDLNNVLSAQVVYPDLILMNLEENSPHVKSLERIKESALKAAAIVQDLLTLARRGVSVAEVVNFNTIIQDYLNSPECERLKGFHPEVQFETRLEKDLFNISGSPVHLFKTIMNLVNNAAEAMPDGGIIRLETENRHVKDSIGKYEQIIEGEYSVLKVSDTGTGIEAEDLERIFEPFYTKKVMGKSGTGLGMAVVWGTVKDHHGFIDVKSVIDKGTVFTLYVPATRKEAGAKTSSLPIEGVKGDGERILVVDDVKEQCSIVEDMLDILGYDPVTAGSGEEAVEYIRSNRADLVILDMIMDPGIDGCETYRQMLELCPGLPAVITSGFSETDRVKETLNLGAGQYLKKPYSLEKLGAAVKKCLTSG